MGRLIIPDDGNGGSPVIINTEPPIPYLWTVANPGTQGFSQLKVSDGSLVRRVQPGLEYSNNEGSLLYDGKGNVWAARRLPGTDSIIKLDSTTGARLGGMDKGTNSGGNNCVQIVFDGTNYWYHTNENDAPNLHCIDVNLGSVRHLAIKPGYRIDTILYDGVGNIWVFMYTTLVKIRASDGANLGEVTPPSWSYGASYPKVSDKTSIWVFYYDWNGGGGNIRFYLRKVRISDFAVTSYGPYQGGPIAGPMAWDGTNLWIVEVPNSDYGDCRLSKIRMEDMSRVGRYVLADPASGVFFDGTNLWLRSGASGGRMRKMTTRGVTLGDYPGIDQIGATFAVAFTDIVMPGDWTQKLEYFWVSNYESPGGLTQIRASDGAYIQRVKTPTVYDHVLYDGTNIWAISCAAAADNLIKIDPISGTVLGSWNKGLSTAWGGRILAFDGTNYWYSVNGTGGGYPYTNQLKCVDANFNLIRSVKVGDGYNAPISILYDGAGNIWSRETSGSYGLYKFRASDGAAQGSVTLSDGGSPRSWWSDGTYIWHISDNPTRLRKILISDLSVTTYGPFTAAGSPLCGGFSDGTNVWFATSNSGTVYLVKVRVSDGVQQGIYVLPHDPRAVRFNGTHLWMVHSGDVDKWTFADPPVLVGTYGSPNISGAQDGAFTDFVLPWP